MARGRRDSELRVGGLKLWARFTLSVSLALAVVMALAGYLLHSATTDISRALERAAMTEAVEGFGRALDRKTLESLVTEDTRLPGDASFYRPRDHEVIGSGAVKMGEGVLRRSVRLRGDGGGDGWLYTWRNKPVLVTPESSQGQLRRGLLGLILGVTLTVILAAALVAWIVSGQVSRPLEELIEDIRQIARGDLRHRTRVRAGGEVELLARTIDRMADSLEEAQEAELELAVREREMEVAAEVREALLPTAITPPAGYEVGSIHEPSQRTGGDFLDTVSLADGRLALFVCEVSGAGVPGALVGATARSYLRGELSRCTDLAQALAQVNRDLGRDVRAGMYVTALVILLDPAQHRVQIACAGHKVPLLRCSAADGKLRTVQPEGIALGFDPGPVFERSLSITDISLAPGDRLLATNRGPLVACSPEGEELGEQRFFRLVRAYADESTDELLLGLGTAIESHADGQPLSADLSLLSLIRKV
ncbi:MAG: hypothetical protein CMJ87_12690 [Planctomycetes bacterium]|nr:hypothetical protein [Planctomycetota bacterium]